MRKIMYITENTDKEALIAAITKYEQYSKLSDIREALRNEIDTGKSTNPATLDKYLDASIQMYHWLARNPSERTYQDEREEAGVSYLQYKKIRDGSYYKEKVGFCLEEAQGHIRVT